MKPLKLSFLLILIGSASLLSGADESGEVNPSTPPAVRIEKHPVTTQNVQASTQKKPEEPTAFQTQFLETLRAIAEQEKAANEQKRTEDESYFSPLNIQSGLLIIGAAYTFFAWRQWQSIKRQANITEQIITHLERPWIIVKPDNWGIPTPHDPGFGGPVEWTLTNVGKTPAFVNEIAIFTDVIPFPLPDVAPDYSPSESIAKFMIPPNGSHSSKANVLVDAAEMRGIFDGKLCVVLFGSVKYTDTLEKVHQTRFCCSWRVKGEKWRYEPVGPPAWIEYT